MGCRRLYALIKNLPPDAALWRTQAPEGDGGPTGDQPRSNPKRLVTTDPAQIHAWFTEHVTG